MDRRNRKEQGKTHTGKRLLSWLLVLAMVLTAVNLPAFTENVQADTAVWSGTGNGSKTNPYQISTPAQLMQFAQIVNSGGSNQYAWAVLTNDINMTGKTWIPIGTEADPFQGSFDGQNHKIENLNTGDSSLSLSGLFGYVQKYDSSSWSYRDLTVGTVSNIQLVSPTVTGGSNTAALCGRLDDGIIENCSVTKGNILGKGDYAAGVCAYSENGTIRNCSVENTTVTAKTTSTETSTETYHDYVGGICGRYYRAVSYNEDGVTRYIEKCYVKGGSLNGNSYIGGVIGSMSYLADVLKNHCTYVKNCYSVSVTMNEGREDGQYQGGFAGSLSNSSLYLSNCYTVNCKTPRLETSPGYSTGYRGSFAGSVNAYVENCYTDRYPAFYINNSNPGEYGPYDNGTIEIKNSEQFASGEVAYLLQEGLEEGANFSWGQNIDNGGTNQGYPVYNGARVYAIRNCSNSITGYSNTASSAMIHSFVQADGTNNPKIPACTNEGCTKLNLNYEGITVTQSADSLTYNGDVQSPTFSVINSDNNSTLTEDTDYEVEMTENTGSDVGSYTADITLNGIGNYVGTISYGEASWSIVPAEPEVAVTVKRTGDDGNVIDRTIYDTTNPNNISLSISAKIANGKNVEGTFVITPPSGYTGGTTQTELLEAYLRDAATGKLKVGETEIPYKFIPKDTKNLSNSQGTFRITVTENTVKSIEIVSDPTKKDYKVGDYFDKTGLQVSATFLDGSTQDVTHDVTIDGGNPFNSDSANVMVSYGGKFASVEKITVEYLSVLDFVVCYNRSTEQKNIMALRMD